MCSNFDHFQLPGRNKALSSNCNHFQPLGRTEANLQQRCIDDLGYDILTALKCQVTLKYSITW